MPHKQGTLLAYYSTCDTIPILPSAVNESGALAAAGQAGLVHRRLHSGTGFCAVSIPPASLTLDEETRWLAFSWRRVLFMVLTLWLVSVTIFVVTEILPGDVATAIMGQEATAEDLARTRERLGLNRPRLVRYMEWVGGAVRGDLGGVVSLPGDHRQGLRRDSENRRTVGELGHAGAADPAGGRAALPGARRGRRALPRPAARWRSFGRHAGCRVGGRSSSAAWC